MSLISYHEIHRNGDKDYKGIFHYLQIFRVIVTGQKESPGTVAAYVPGNLFTTTWYDNTLARLKKKSADQVSPSDDGGAVWQVSLEFDNEPLDIGTGSTDLTSPSGDPGQSSKITKPDLRPPSLDIDSVEVQELRDVDYSVPAKRLCASNGQPFVPPLTIYSYHPLLTFGIFKALGADNFANTVTYTGRVNSDVWNGFAANKLLCRKYKLTSQFEHNAWWWQKTVTIEVKEDLWNPLKIMDAGTYERAVDYTDGKKFKPIRVNGVPATSPVPLNLAGKALAANLDPLYLEFKQYKIQAFANIL